MDVGDLEIHYPVRWQYTLFGRDEGALRAAIDAVLAGRDVTVDLSKRSTRGTYLSLSVELVVRDEDDRTGIWRALAARAEVLYVV
ncbi:hypothetical protein Pla163_17750 [Planctomycetes bacterium Pla163]|uniref:DUF493 domain-containing protein n=1 Tax=Rohdeia mirabilis TaxID=2528008 RepID=A0A518CZM2_9BACT|nr:hypothetical protein Pla163_17750 [Planctomycetes bacterium Pla163]